MFSCFCLEANELTLAFSSKPSPPAPLPKGEGRVHLIFLFPLLLREGAQRAGEGGSFAVRDIFFIPATSESRLNGN